ncbi:unnamed protein product, partial [Rotaria sp. Silwood2]
IGFNVRAGIGGGGGCAI